MILKLGNSRCPWQQKMFEKREIIAETKTSLLFAIRKYNSAIIIMSR